MANRFWVGGSGNWSDTAHWASTSGGAGGQTVPGTADVATIDGHASGLNGGTLTIDADITVNTLIWGAAVGTIDNSGNRNVTITGSTGFSGSGSGARTWTGGTGTYTLSSASTTWAMTTTTNLTNPTTAFASAVLVFSGNSSASPNTFSGGGLTYGNVTFNGQSNGGGVVISGANTFAALTIGAPNWTQFPSSITQTVTSLVATGTSSAPVALESNNSTNQAVISDSSGTNAFAWCSIRCMSFTGGATFSASSSADLGRNSGITITAPSAGGSAAYGMVG
jgi:hypothetical protein